ncbi:prepilin peptidase [Butyrivibrio sp. INlla16]|uniref:prepilin peptidase n=1 Tax=Butyrivibrio sp. INlla16 TaxID=1520807 RepID=UPI0008802313|nr:prepilin peptidase [Butyrivibrio sp. INlla16]SDB54704.1 leader peptidase (prepilin peptidase) / N-methyltransferase [Butyrivibrio sp. INlla16]
MDFYEIIENTVIVSLFFKVFALIILLIATIMDIREKKIPLSIPTVQMTLSGLCFIYLWSKGITQPADFLYSLIPGIVLLTVSYFTRQGIGLGDGLTVLALGPLFGIMDTMLIVLISFTFSAVIGVILLIMKKVSGKSVMAFMPFLTVGVGVMSFAFR